jgi:hypothetical protein
MKRLRNILKIKKKLFFELNYLLNNLFMYQILKNTTSIFEQIKILKN